MSLRVLLADADGTLFDFHRGEAVAIGETFRRFGIPDTPGNLEIYSRVNHAQWLRLERGETTQERLRVDRFTDLRETRRPCATATWSCWAGSVISCPARRNSAAR